MNQKTECEEILETVSLTLAKFRSGGGGYSEMAGCLRLLSDAIEGGKITSRYDLEKIRNGLRFTSDALRASMWHDLENGIITGSA